MVLKLCWLELSIVKAGSDKCCDKSVVVWFCFKDVLFVAILIKVGHEAIDDWEFPDVGSTSWYLENIIASCCTLWVGESKVLFEGLVVNKICVRLRYKFHVSKNSSKFEIADFQALLNVEVIEVCVALLKDIYNLTLLLQNWNSNWYSQCHI